MTNFIPDIGHLEFVWVDARVRAVPGLTQEEATAEFQRGIRQHNANVRADVEDSIKKSFDHRYDEWIDDGYMDDAEFAQREGYRHRDRQVQTVFELFRSEGQ